MLIAQYKNEPEQHDAQRSPDLAEQQAAPDGSGAIHTDELRARFPIRSDTTTPKGSRGRVTHSNVRLPICGARLLICSNRTTHCRANSPSISRSLSKPRRSLLTAHELDEARGEATTLRYGIDALRKQRQAEEALLALQKVQEQLAAAVPPRHATPKPTPRPGPPVPVPQPRQSTPSPQLSQPMPTPQPMSAPSAAQQLQTARQWLSADARTRHDAYWR